MHQRAFSFILDSTIKYKSSIAADAHPATTATQLLLACRIPSVVLALCWLVYVAFCIGHVFLHVRIGFSKIFPARAVHVRRHDVSLYGWFLHHISIIDMLSQIPYYSSIVFKQQGVGGFVWRASIAIGKQATGVQYQINIPLSAALRFSFKDVEIYLQQSRSGRSRLGMALKIAC